MRTFCHVLLVLSSLASSTAQTISPAHAANDSEHANVLFIMTDDLGPWAIGAAGERNARTPNLDRLRSQGAMLTKCYSPTPVCSPARGSVLTSRYGTELGILGPISVDSKSALDPGLPTWPRMLSQAGYASALVGKYHLGYRAESHPTRIGYGEFAGFIGNGRTSVNPDVEIDGELRNVKGWTPDILTDLAIGFIERQRDRPWALSLHFWATHANQVQRSPDGDRTWLPLSHADWEPFENVEPILPEPDYPKLDIPRTMRMIREYMGSLHSVDRNVGRLMRRLDELGLAQNTFVVFTSDHGFNVGHHGIWHKGNGKWLLLDNRGPRPNLWDTSLRVPALVRWPGRIEAGDTINATISHLDWFPTIAALTGTPIPSQATIHGRNVLPVLQGESASWPDDFYSQQSDRRSYHTDRWKLVRFVNQSLPDEFYDRVEDPQEKRSLIDSTAPVVKDAIRDLHARLLKRMAAINDPALNKLQEIP